jgi:hypothetical protein
LTFISVDPDFRASPECTATEVTVPTAFDITVVGGGKATVMSTAWGLLEVRDPTGTNLIAGAATASLDKVPAKGTRYMKATSGTTHKIMRGSKKTRNAVLSRQPYSLVLRASIALAGIDFRF